MATTPDAPAMLTLDRSDGSVTIDLYRAALGPIHTDYYLKAFTRLDAAGKAGPSWNWSAALLGLNWLLFRQLYTHALAYVGALTAALLLFFGIGRLVFQLSDASQWGLMGVAVLLAIAVPGAMGNAWLYTACNRRIEATLVGAASTEEACTLLAQGASGRKQQGLLATGNLALLAAIAGIVLAWPGSNSLPLNSSKMDQARLAAMETVPSGLAAQSVAAAASAAPAASARPAASAAPAMPTALAASAPAVLAASAPATAMASAPQASPPVAAPAAPPVSTPAVTTRSSQGLVQNAAASTYAPAPPLLAASAPVKASTAPAPATAKASAEAPKAKPAKPAAAVASSAPPSDKFLINVGLFADANNARNAYTKLKDAGLPALSQPMKSSTGLPRTRVRAGPFDSQAEADAAAEAIRALKLDAVVVKP